MQPSRIFLAIGAALAVCASGAAFAQQVTLRGVNAFQEGSAFAKPFEDFIKKVNEDGKGVIRIQYIGGPKAMPPFEVGNAVKTGVVDIANVTSAFYTNLMPEAESLKLATQTIQQQRKSGAWEFLNKLHNEKMNVWYLARTGDGVPFHLYLNKPIDKADLHGLTLRGRQAGVLERHRSDGQGGAGHGHSIRGRRFQKRTRVFCRVIHTPHRMGRPTASQASTSFAAKAAGLASTPAATAVCSCDTLRSAASSASDMKCLSASGRTSALATRPTTSKPTRMYMVTS